MGGRHHVLSNIRCGVEIGGIFQFEMHAQVVSAWPQTSQKMFKTKGYDKQFAVQRSTIFKNGTVNDLFLWAIYTMAMLNNQRV